MKNIDTNEQWKLDDNCKMCRKNKYCDKSCFAYKSSVNRDIKSEFYTMLLGGRRNDKVYQFNAVYATLGR